MRGSVNAVSIRLITLFLGVVVSLIYVGFKESPLPVETAESTLAPSTAVSHVSSIAASRAAILAHYGEDTTVDAALRTDAKGNLIVDISIKDLFEYFWADMGRYSQDEIIDRIHHHIRSTLPSPAQEQALAIVDNYLKYRLALEEISAPALDAGLEAVHDMETTLESRKAMRREYLGLDIADKLFLEEEHYDDYTLARLKIQGNTLLNDQEKASQLFQLEQNTDPTLLHFQHEQKKWTAFKHEIATISEKQVSDDTLYNVYERYYGPDAANRLLELQKQRQQWQQRYQEYSQLRLQYDNSNLSPDDKKTQIEALRQSLFNPREQMRVAVLDRMY